MLIENFLRLFRPAPTQVSNSELWCSKLTYDELGLIEYAYGLCVQIVGNLVGACEKKTFKQGKQIEEKLYYQLNVNPNATQSSNVFWKKIINSMFYNCGEALVVEIAGDLHVASSFTVEKKPFVGNIYKDVYVDDIKVRKNNGVFKEREVWHFDFSDFLKSKALVSGEFYSKILKIVSKQYLKKKYDKSVFEVPGVNPLNPGERDIQMRSVMEETVKKFVDVERDATLVLDGNVKIGKYESTMGEGYNDDAPNILSFSDNIMQVIASMFSLPLGVLKGEDVSLNAHIKLFLNPLLTTIEDEINRKKFNQYTYLSGSRVVISTVNIQQVSPMEKAQTNDLNLRSGIYSVNEIRRYEGMEIIKEKWADAHFMTLNYDVVDKFIDGTQGSGGGVNKNSPTNREEEQEDDNTDEELEDKE